MTDIFNHLANHYDTPERLALAKIIRKEIEKNLPEQTLDKTIIDYGGGTGLVSLPFAKRFKELTIVDSAESMLAITDQKIKTLAIPNAHTLQADASQQLPKIKADVLLVTLVLLHIPETETILTKLFQLLNDHGQLFIVDLNKNDQIEHPKVHNGFDQVILSEQLTQAGFQSVSSYTFYHGSKLFMKKDASLFLATGIKR